MPRVMVERIAAPANVIDLNGHDENRQFVRIGRTIDIPEEVRVGILVGVAAVEIDAALAGA